MLLVLINLRKNRFDGLTEIFLREAEKNLDLISFFNKKRDSQKLIFLTKGRKRGENEVTEEW